VLSVASSSWHPEAQMAEMAAAAALLAVVAVPAVEGAKMVPDLPAGGAARLGRAEEGLVAVVTEVSMEVGGAEAVAEMGSEMAGVRQALVVAEMATEIEVVVVERVVVVRAMVAVATVRVAVVKAMAAVAAVAMVRVVVAMVRAVVVRAKAEVAMVRVVVATATEVVGMVMVAWMEVRTVVGRGHSQQDMQAVPVVTCILPSRPDLGSSQASPLAHQLAGSRMAPPAEGST